METLRRNVDLHIGDGSINVRMQVIGEHGGVEFTFYCFNELPYMGAPAGCIKPGGVEYHWKAHNRPDYFRTDETPKHTDCKITGGECWHDGTSLWASEYWFPGMNAQGADWVWRNLENEYAKKIDPATADPQ